MATQPLADWERAAAEYLRNELGERAPAALQYVGQFNEAPLEGEGRTALFSFELSGGSAADCGGASAGERKHYVAIGETTPNFFPGYRLSGDDAYSFHVGTRFMLVMGLEKVDPELEPPGARETVRRLVADHLPDARVEGDELAALFRCEAGYFAVYRLVVNEQPVYALGADCPPGFYYLTHFPPQTALRLHLGKVIRAEKRAAAAE